MENANLLIEIYKQKYQGLWLRFDREKNIFELKKNIQINLFLMSLFYDKDIVHKSKSVEFVPSRNW